MIAQRGPGGVAGAAVKVPGGQVECRLAHRRDQRPLGEPAGTWPVLSPAGAAAQSDLVVAKGAEGQAEREARAPDQSIGPTADSGLHAGLVDDRAGRVHVRSELSVEPDAPGRSDTPVARLSRTGEPAGHRKPAGVARDRKAEEGRGDGADHGVVEGGGPPGPGGEVDQDGRHKRVPAEDVGAAHLGVGEMVRGVAAAVDLFQLGRGPCGAEIDGEVSHRVDRADRKGDLAKPLQGRQAVEGEHPDLRARGELPMLIEPLSAGGLHAPQQEDSGHRSGQRRRSHGRGIITIMTPNTAARASWFRASAKRDLSVWVTALAGPSSRDAELGATPCRDAPNWVAWTSTLTDVVDARPALPATAAARRAGVIWLASPMRALCAARSRAAWNAGSRVTAWRNRAAASGKLPRSSASRPRLKARNAWRSAVGRSAMARRSAGESTMPSRSSSPSTMVFSIVNSSASRSAAVPVASTCEVSVLTPFASSRRAPRPGSRIAPWTQRAARRRWPERASVAGSPRPAPASLSSSARACTRSRSSRVSRLTFERSVTIRWASPVSSGLSSGSVPR